MISYAQNNEDVLLERLFGERKTGVYVDVGAWDPTVHSVTRHFYDRGWRGVNIEPIAARCRQFEAARPKDVNLCVAVGAARGKATFYECEEESYLSTLSAEVAGEMRARGLTLRERQIDVLPLSTVFKKHASGTVDFLKIDVEGYEAETLAGLDLASVRPRCLVIEATKPASGLPDWDEPEAQGLWDAWEPRVLAAGYALALFDGLNRFYLRSEDAALGRRLTLPVGIFDQVQRPEEIALRDEVATLRNELDLRLERLTAVDADLQALRTDQEAKQTALRLQATEVSALRQVVEERQQLHDGLMAAREALSGFINERVGAVAERVAETRDGLATQMEARLGGLDARLDQVRDAVVGQVGERMTAVGEVLEAVAAAQAAQGGAVGERLTAIGQVVEAVSGAQVAQADAIAERLTAIGEVALALNDAQALQTAQVSERLTAFGAVIESLAGDQSARADQVAERLTAVGTLIEGTAARQAGVAAQSIERLDVFGRVLDGLSSAQALQGGQSTERLDALGGLLEHMDGRLRAAVAGLDAALAAEARLAALDARLNDLDLRLRDEHDHRRQSVMDAAGAASARHEDVRIGLAQVATALEAAIVRQGEAAADQRHRNAESVAAAIRESGDRAGAALAALDDRSERARAADRKAAETFRRDLEDRLGGLAEAAGDALKRRDEALARLSEQREDLQARTAADAVLIAEGAVTRARLESEAREAAAQAAELRSRHAALSARLRLRETSLREQAGAGPRRPPAGRPRLGLDLAYQGADGDSFLDETRPLVEALTSGEDLSLVLLARQAQAPALAARYGGAVELAFVDGAPPSRRWPWSPPPQAEPVSLGRLEATAGLDAVLSPDGRLSALDGSAPLLALAEAAEPLGGRRPAGALVDRRVDASLPAGEAAATQAADRAAFRRRIVELCRQATDPGEQA